MLKRGLAIAAVLALATSASAQDKKPPYWASIASGEAMMRTGPGRNYPGIWLYKRRDLPIRVLQVYPNWRKIEDPDWQQGWMLVTLLSDRRTCIVKPGAPGTASTPDPQKLMELRPNERSEFTLVPGIPGVGDVVERPLGQSNLLPQ